MEKEPRQTSSPGIPPGDDQDTYVQLAEDLYEDLPQLDDSTSDLGTAVENDSFNDRGLIEAEELRELRRIATALSQTSPPSESGEPGARLQQIFSIDSNSPTLKPGSPNFNPGKCKSCAETHAHPPTGLSWRQIAFVQEPHDIF